MKGLNILILAVVAVIGFYVISHVMKKKSAEGLSVSPYFGRPVDFAAVIKCEDDLGKYYKNKYSDKVRYRNSSTDARDYQALKNQQANYTMQDVWKGKMQASMGDSYVDNKGNAYGKSNSVMTNANIPPKGKFNQNDRAGAAMHPAMANNKNTEGMTNGGDKNAQLSASDLLPDPCLNKGKDWTNVFSECENLLGGQNFVRFEDEHFTNQVLDTRCTKLQSEDLRRPPAVQYADVSIWNKPSTCKNIFEYIRPTLDGEC